MFPYTKEAKDYRPPLPYTVLSSNLVINLCNIRVLSPVVIGHGEKTAKVI